MPVIKCPSSRNPNRVWFQFATGLSAALLLQVGCSSGSVEFTDVEDIGTISSATWHSGPDITIYRLSSSGTLSGQDSRFLQSITLSTQRQNCNAERDYLEAWEQATLELLEASDNESDAEAVCAGMGTFLDQYIEAIELRSETDRYIVFNFIEAGSLDERTYPLVTPSEASDDDHAIGFLSYRDPEGSLSDYYYALKEAWRPDTCVFDQDTLESYTWNGDRWTFDSGTVTIDTIMFEEGAHGTFEGTLTDQDGQGAGSASGSFESEFCDRGDGYQLFRP